MIFLLYIFFLNHLSIFDFNKNEILIDIDTPKILILFDNNTCSQCLFKFKSILEDEDYKKLKFEKIFVVFPATEQSLNKRNFIKNFNNFDIKVDNYLFDSKVNSIFKEFEFSNSPMIIILKNKKFERITAKYLSEVNNQDKLKNDFLKKCKLLE